MDNIIYIFHDIAYYYTVLFEKSIWQAGNEAPRGYEEQGNLPFLFMGTWEHLVYLGIK